jgi:hypothetical protein
VQVRVGLEADVAATATELTYQKPGPWTRTDNKLKVEANDNGLQWPLIAFGSRPLRYNFWIAVGVDPALAEDDGLAIEHKSLLADLASGLKDPVIKRPARTSPRMKTSA